MSGAMAVRLLAAVLTTVAFVPQVLKTWRTRSTTDLSECLTLIAGAISGTSRLFCREHLTQEAGGDGRR